jgi:hypothetical protein
VLGATAELELGLGEAAVPHEAAMSMMPIASTSGARAPCLFINVDPPLRQLPAHDYERALLHVQS